jgi:glutaredoxin
VRQGACDWRVGLGWWRSGARVRARGGRSRWALLIAVWLASPVLAAETLTLYVFVGHDCPHCEAQMPFLEGLQAEQDGLSVQRFDVSRTREHHARFRSMAGAHGVEPTAVPTLFVGGRVWIGDGARVRAEISAHVRTCLQHGCPDSAALAESGQQMDLVDSASEATVPAQGLGALANDTVIDLPWLGAVDLGVQPLVVSTVLIAFVDGFNPCSLWVLTVLLALVIHSGSRRRIVLVGVVYLVVTASIYGLFIAGVFGVLSYALYLDWVYWLVALFALFFAVVNINSGSSAACR